MLRRIIPFLLIIKVWSDAGVAIPQVSTTYIKGDVDSCDTVNFPLSEPYFECIQGKDLTGWFKVNCDQGGNSNITQYDNSGPNCTGGVSSVESGSDGDPYVVMGGCLTIQCSKETFCNGTQEAPENGTPGTCSSPVLHSSSCTMTCNQGFTPVGSLDRTCTANGNDFAFSSIQATCENITGTPTLTPTPTSTPTPTPTPTPTSTPTSTPNTTTSSNTPPPTPPPDYCTGTFCATLNRANCLAASPQLCGLCYPNYQVDNGVQAPNKSLCSAWVTPQRPQGFAMQAKLKFLGKCPIDATKLAALITAVLTNISAVIPLPKARVTSGQCNTFATNRFTITYQINPDLDTATLTPTMGQQLIANLLATPSSKIYKTLPTLIENDAFITTWKTLKVVYCYNAWVLLGTCAASSNLVSTLTVTIGPSKNLVFGAAVNFKAAITCTGLPAGTFPTGQVRFFSSGVSLGANSTKPGTNQVQLHVLGVKVAHHQITAAYYGDRHCRVAYQNTPVSLVVTKAPSTMKLVASPVYQQQGKNVRLTVTFTYPTTLPAALRPSGSVNYYLAPNTLLVNKKINYNTGITYLAGTLTTGLKKIHVSYAGDNNWQAVNSTTVNIAICSGAVPTASCGADHHYVCCTNGGKAKNTWTCRPNTVTVC